MEGMEQQAAAGTVEDLIRAFRAITLLPNHVLSCGCVTARPKSQACEFCPEMRAWLQTFGCLPMESHAAPGVATAGELPAAS